MSTTHSIVSVVVMCSRRADRPALDSGTHIVTPPPAMPADRDGAQEQRAMVMRRLSDSATRSFQAYVDNIVERCTFALVAARRSHWVYFAEVFWTAQS